MPCFFRNSTIICHFHYRWAKVAILYLPYMALPGVVIYLDSAQDWTILLNGCAMNQFWPFWLGTKDFKVLLFDWSNFLLTSLVPSGLFRSNLCISTQKELC